MNFRKVRHEFSRYLLSEYELSGDTRYYFFVSLVVGFVFTCFVFSFDPYDNYASVRRYDIDMRLIQLGYGVNVTIVVFMLYYVVFEGNWFKRKKFIWKTYHHWLLLVSILAVSGFTGTVYHRTMMVVEEVDSSYYIFVTIPRSILIGLSLFIVTILLDKLRLKNKYISQFSPGSLQQVAPNLPSKDQLEESISISSPSIRQKVDVLIRDIQFIKTNGNYIELHLKSRKKPHLIRITLNRINVQLSAYDFFAKCHRQYIINLNEVESVKGNTQKSVVRLKNMTDSIPVSKSYSKQLLQRLNSGVLGSSSKV